MQLSPSTTVSLDSNLLALLAPGANAELAACMASATPSAAPAGATSAELTFEQLMPSPSAASSNTAELAGGPPETAAQTAQPTSPLFAALPLTCKRLPAAGATPIDGNEDAAMSVEDELVSTETVASDSDEKSAETKPTKRSLHGREAARSGPHAPSDAMPAPTPSPPLPSVPASDVNMAAMGSAKAPSEREFEPGAVEPEAVDDIPQNPAQSARRSLTKRSAGPTANSPSGSVPTPKIVSGRAPGAPMGRGVSSEAQESLAVRPRFSAGFETETGEGGDAQESLPIEPAETNTAPGDVVGRAFPKQEREERQAEVRLPLPLAMPSRWASASSPTPLADRDAGDISLSAGSLANRSQLNGDGLNASHAPVVELPHQPGLSEPPAIPHSANPLPSTARSLMSDPLPEKFADLSEEFRAERSAARGGSEKNFVRAKPQRLTVPADALGIGVAKTDAAMFSRASLLPVPHPASEYAVAAVASASHPEHSLAQPPAPVALEVPTAHQAVEAVLRAVDHHATRDQHSVNLRFAVGDSDLQVRVELHADEVRTTFRTDSAELRSALSHEWQAVAESGAERSFRIAPATFTCADAQGGSGFSGDSSRERHAQQGPRELPEFFVPGGGIRAGTTSTAVNARSATRSSAPVAPRGSRLLSTHA